MANEKISINMIVDMAKCIRHCNLSALESIYYVLNMLVEFNVIEPDDVARIPLLHSCDDCRETERCMMTKRDSIFCSQLRAENLIETMFDIIVKQKDGKQNDG